MAIDQKQDICEGQHTSRSLHAVHKPEPVEAVLNETVESLAERGFFATSPDFLLAGSLLKEAMDWDEEGAQIFASKPTKVADGDVAFDHPGIVNHSDSRYFVLKHLVESKQGSSHDAYSDYTFSSVKAKLF